MPNVTTDTQHEHQAPAYLAPEESTGPSRTVGATLAAAKNRVITWWRTVDWREVRYMAAGIAPFAGGLLVLIAVISMIVLITKAGVGAINNLDVIAQHLLDWPVTGIVVTPIVGFITSHAAGLAADPALLTYVWGIGTAILYALACMRSRGARIGWIIVGACSTAMAYAGTPPPNQAIAAGATMLAWALLSVFAFTARPTAPIHVSVPTPSSWPDPAPLPRPRRTREHSDVINACVELADGFLQNASSHEPGRDRDAWLSAARIVSNLASGARLDRYRAEYGNKAHALLSDMHHTPEQHDLDTAREYVQLAIL